MGKIESDFDCPSDYLPQKLDLNHMGLSSLFNFAAMEIDNYLIRGNEPHTFVDYQGKQRTIQFDFRPVARVGRILYSAVESKNLSNYDPTVLLLLSKIVAEETGTEPKTIEEIITPTRKLGLEFIKMKELSREEQRKLANISVKFSELARQYWHYYNDNRRFFAA